MSCWYWEALQVSHSLQASHMAPRLAPEGRIEFSAEPGRLQMKPRQRLQMLPPEPGLSPAAEIRPLLESINIPIVCAYVLQAETAASLVVQVPSAPLHISQPISAIQARPAGQLSEVQVGSIVTVSPAQLLHVHVVVSAVGGSAVDETFVTRQGGHSSVAAQQPLLPTLEPSAHVAAEAPAAKTSTITNAVSLPTKAIRGPFAARAAARAAAAR